MSQIYELTLKISRYNPDTRRSWVQGYRLKAGRILRFVDLFRKINDEQDPTLAWSSSCEHGQCGTCGMKINGKPVLTCEVLVENAVKLFKTESFTIEPLTVAPVIRDLVIDMDRAYERVHFVKPYLIQPAPPTPTAMNTGFRRGCWRPTLRQPGALIAFVVRLHALPKKTTLGRTACWLISYVSWIREKQPNKKGWTSYTASRQPHGAVQRGHAALYARRRSTLPILLPWQKKGALFRPGRTPKRKNR